ncbi:MAG: flagellar basal body rod protein FlgB [candidate division Zixibacteria bacterium]|nr:flagellar basal body rod protein FlgB [candidate division Zixibacteria bacterium]
MENKLSTFMFQRMGVPRFEKYLNLSSFRQKLIGGNIANVSTPGFKSQDINFKQEYERATGGDGRLSGTMTHPTHIPLGSHESRPPDVAQAKPAEGEMNSVDIDAQVSNLAQNELRYTITAKLLQLKFSGMKKAITSK